MRFALVAILGLGLSLVLVAPEAKAQDTAACDTKFEELLKKLQGRTMPTPQRADYTNELLGAYQSCRQNKEGAWIGIENKINA